MCGTLALDDSVIDAADGLTECQRAAPCEYAPASGCHFAFPTCCDPSETIECAIVPEEDEAQLVCDPGCVCDPACPDMVGEPHWKDNCTLGSNILKY